MLEWGHNIRNTILMLWRQRACTVLVRVLVCRPVVCEKLIPAWKCESLDGRDTGQLLTEMQSHLHSHMYTCTHAHTRVHTHTHTHTHSRTHTHTRTQKSAAATHHLWALLGRRVWSGRCALRSQCSSGRLPHARSHAQSRTNLSPCTHTSQHRLWAHCEAAWACAPINKAQG